MAALKTPSTKKSGSPGTVTFDASAVKAPKGHVADKTFPVTPLVTPRPSGSSVSGDPAATGTDGSKFATPHAAVSKRQGGDKLGAAVVTGPPPNRVRAKGQPVGEIASSLEFPSTKRKCA